MTLPIFPTLSGLVYPVKRAPMMNSDIYRGVTGKRTAVANFSYPLWKYEIGYSFLRSTNATLEWQTLVAFWLRVYGAANVWQFTDPDDNSTTDQSIGLGDGQTTEFQLVRALTGSGANTFVEPVWVPTGTPVVKIDGTPTLDFTISDTGLVTFNSAPVNGAALTWTGTYNWLCRFDADSLDLSKFAYQFWELEKVTFSTEKL